MSAVESPSRPTPRVALVLLGVILLAAAALRVLAARNDLWLDELVSLWIAQHIQTLSELFLKYNQDNNHHLNTLALHMLGSDQPPLVYRMPAIVMGVAAVAAAYWAGIDRTWPRRLLFAFLVAVNYPLVHFSSEARGYSGAVLASLLAFAAIDRYLFDLGPPLPTPASPPVPAPAPRLRWLLLFYAAFLLGVFSHLTFCFIWGALVVWSLVVLLRERPAGPPLERWALLHGPPLAVLVCFYFGCLRTMNVLKGPAWPPVQIIRWFLAPTLGLPFDAAWAVWPIVGLFAGLAACALFAGRRSRRCEWVFYAMLLAPFAFLLVVRPKFPFPRYLLVIAPFLCDLLALILVRGAAFFSRRGNAPRFGWAAGITAAAVLAAMVAGHLTLFDRLLHTGRGSLSGVAAYLARHNPGPIIAIASDQGWRTQTEYPYLAGFLPPDKQLTDIKPEWFLRHGEGIDPPAPPTVHDQLGRVWVRKAFFPCAELSGQAFTLYHLEPAPATTATNP